MPAHQISTAIDLEQLRNITLDDQELMREIVAALIDDTSQQLQSLETAIREVDGARTMRIAHYSKGACANVGATAAAALLLNIEQKAEQGDFTDCRASLMALAGELDRLRFEASSL